MTFRWCIAVIALGALPTAAARAQHPPVTLVDQDGKNVLESGQPISTMRSCNHCHDTQYIATHSYHVSLGNDDRAPLGTIAGGRPWEWSTGPLGRWNPLIYRYLPPPHDPPHDLVAAEWIATFPRHVGGGPALGRSAEKKGTGSEPVREGSATTALRAMPAPSFSRGGVEMNCFLCHTPKPDNAARLSELWQGRFPWANTATLASTGLVHPTQQGWAYQRDAFLPDGRLDARKLGIQEPASENCGLCHGQAGGGEQPLGLELSLRQWSTATKGEVFSPQRICQSASNLRDKDRLTRSWDVHAERLLQCANCHFSINNPAFSEPAPDSRPRHLTFEPRRQTVGQYIKRPSHQFAKGHTSQGTFARHLEGTMRRCDDCHNAAATHAWLPYQEAHFARLSCEACHIPQVYAPALRQVDWTLPTPAGEPQVQWRGIQGDPSNPTALVTGFRPLLLPAKDLDGRTRLVPHNLISAWYWVEGGAKPRPVALAILQAALVQDGKYRADIAAALGNRAVLDTPQKVEAVRRRLEAAGAVAPHIEAEIQPYSLHHGVGPAKWATRKCETCHAGDSCLGDRFTLASYVPGGIRPAPVTDSGTELDGHFQTAAQGQLLFEPGACQTSLYVLGHHHSFWVNALGGLSLAAVVLGVMVHAGLRVRLARKAPGVIRADAANTVPSPSGRELG